MKSRRHFLLTAPAVAVAGFPVATTASNELRPGRHGAFDVTDFGAVGDGRTHSADAFQQAIDAAETAGGGVVHIPPGMFILEKTPLIASDVHLLGAGAATVLRGQRPQGSEGAALISNKGQHAPGYEGAHDWSISHLSINSPDTNGIVVTHAARVYIGFIYGVDVFHHFVDTAGRDILCENLYLTGRSGTSTFQVDSLSSAQTIWDGEKAVAPLRDATDTQDLILRNSFITATAGHTGSRPHHNVSVHLHGDEARGFTFSDLVLGGAETGFYQDANTAYHDMQINNVRCLNPGQALCFAPGKTGQRNLMIRGLSHTPPPSEKTPRIYHGLEIHGRHGLLLSDIQLAGDVFAETAWAIHVAASSQVRISGVQARGHKGYGILLRDGATPMDQTLVQGCLLSGFETGCNYDGKQRNAINTSANIFHGIGNACVGAIHSL